MSSSTESMDLRLDGAVAVRPEEQERGLSRRAFIAGGVAAGVGAGLGPFGMVPDALADKPPSTKLGKGDAAILRFLATAEILETDFWQQYNELGGIQDSEVPGGSGSKTYTEALEVLDEDMPQYIHDNTEDEFTHFTFLNAYLESRGAEAVNLKEFANLPSSKATGAQQIGRLTNLMELTVDTTWWTRYAWPKANSRRSRAATQTSNKKTTFRRSRTRRGSTSPRSSRAARACIPRSPSGQGTPRRCAWCSASGPPRRCTSRPGKTRRAMHLL